MGRRDPASLNGLTVAVINLDRRPDRYAALTERWAAAGQTRPLRRFPAVDTGTDDGCLASHRQLLATADGPVLVLEDDSCFAPQFTLDLAPPAGWDVLWLGGQHHREPRPVDTVWARPRYMVRTHAYIARRPRRLAALMQSRAIPRMDPHLAALPLNQYVLRIHTVGQAAGISDIDGHTRTADQYWNRPDSIVRLLRGNTG